MSSQPPEPPVPAPRRVPAQRPGRAGGRRDENRRRRTAGLCQAALGLFLERGIEAVTIDEIVTAAGMSKGSFYRYFVDKTDLVDAILEPLGGQVRAAFEAFREALPARRDERGLMGAYETLASSLVLAFLAHTGAVQLYLQESRGPDVGARAPVRQLSDDVMEMTIELTEVAVEHRLLRPFDPRVTAAAVVGAAERILFEFVSGNELGDPAQVTEALITMVLEGHRERST